MWLTYPPFKLSPLGQHNYIFLALLSRGKSLFISERYNKQHQSLCQSKGICIQNLHTDDLLTNHGWSLSLITTQNHCKCKCYYIKAKKKKTCSTGDQILKSGWSVGHGFFSIVFTWKSLCPCSVKISVGFKFDDVVIALYHYKPRIEFKT